MSELAVFPFDESALILVDGDPASAITLSDLDTGTPVPLSDGDPRCGSVPLAPDQRQLRLRVQVGDGSVQILTALWPRCGCRLTRPINRFAEIWCSELRADVIDEVLEEIEASITQGRVRGLPELRRDPARLSTAVQTRLAIDATMAMAARDAIRRAVDRCGPQNGPARGRPQ